ncbi:hypothetical protein BpHYR1_022065 [Brachionus plicatilis]|uniref:Uncharacterized protein n=1 Tax=Brachionus plicatilis TaxID=10195 RepID=A0A3M7PIQ4_BRAPC|nr:hypothetical protein BpHYR1_022065 [Brachionus plicatilis]
MVSVQKGVYDAYVTSQAGIINDLKKRLSELETKCADLLVNNQNLTKRVEELEKNEKNNSNGKKLFSDLFNKNNPDLTFAERELNKTLVAKRKDLNNNNDSTTSGFRYGIRNYDIINSNNPTL